MTVTNANTLADYLLELTHGSPLPISGDDKKGPKSLGRLSEGDRIAEVDEGTFRHFLDAVAKRYLERGFFCCAERYGPYWLFWGKNGRFFVRPLLICQCCHCPFPDCKSPIRFQPNLWICQRQRIRTI